MDMRAKTGRRSEVYWCGVRQNRCWCVDLYGKIPGHLTQNQQLGLHCWVDARANEPIHVRVVAYSAAAYNAWIEHLPILLQTLICAEKFSSSQEVRQTRLCLPPPAAFCPFRHGSSRSDDLCLPLFDWKQYLNNNWPSHVSACPVFLENNSPAKHMVGLLFSSSHYHKQGMTDRMFSFFSVRNTKLSEPITSPGFKLAGCDIFYVCLFLSIYLCSPFKNVRILYPFMSFCSACSFIQVLAWPDMIQKATLWNTMSRI